MRPEASRHPPGTIIVPMGAVPRYDAFYTALEQVRVPLGTLLIKQSGVDLVGILNAMMTQRRGAWVWFLGDDHDWAADTLLRLLDREVPAVIPLVASRHPPFPPVILHGPVEGPRTPYTWDEVWAHDRAKPLPSGDLAGTAGLLVQESVWQQIPYPWFEGGRLVPGRLMEDLWLIHTLHQKGVPLYVEPTAVLSHWYPSGVRPVVGVTGITLQHTVSGQVLPALMEEPVG